MLHRGLAFCVVAALALPVSAADFTSGNAEVKSIEVIAFGPDGLLLIGDGPGGQVIVIQTADTKPTPWSKAPQGDLREEIAKRLGAQAKDIEIQKLAVNPASHTAYLAVRKLPGKQDLILTLDGNGKIREFSLEGVKHAVYSLSAAGKSPITKITDLTYAKGKVLVAAQANETFASKIVAIDLNQPSDKASSFVSAETYHVAHRRWETKAPIRSVIPYEQDGKTYLVGAFTCTPIVKYSLDEIKTGGKIKGETIIELGSGNQPLDMFAYKKGGKSYILMNALRFHHDRNPVGPSKYWTVKVEQDLLREGGNVNEKALWRVKNKASEPITDRAVVAADFHGVVHMDQLDDSRALGLRSDNKGGLEAVLLTLP